MDRHPSWTTDALICGAGPTGLTAAGQLAMRGVRCRLIDKAPLRSDRSRALVVQPRTLELLDKIGGAADLVASGERTMSLALYVNRRPAAAVEFGEMTEVDTAYPFLLFTSQVETERVLEAHAAAHGVRTERPVELVSFTQDEGGVDARLRHAGGREEVVRAGYLIGADGAHSVVRKCAGIEFQGAAYEQDFVLADVDIDWELRGKRVMLSLCDTGLLGVFPLKGERLHRIIAVRAEGPEGGAAAGDPTLAEVQALCDERGPVPMRLSSPRWLTRFRLHHRAVTRYRAGRAFLCGDAAHIHSPAGGQGMNTGIQDAWNLGWKLALALGGRGGEALLESYNAERHPVGQELLRTTDRMFSMATSRSAVVKRVRNLLAAHVAPQIWKRRGLRARIFRFIGQLAIAYPDSPVVAEDLAGADAAFRHGPGKGERAPDAPLGEGSDAPGGAAVDRVQALLRGARHHALLFSGVGEAAALPQVWATAAAVRERAGDLAEVHVIAHGSALAGAVDLESAHRDRGPAHERYGLAGPGLYLVRPDGYIAFRAAGADPASLLAFLGRYRG